MEECFLDFDLSEPTEVAVDFESEDVGDCEWELEPSPKAAGTSSSTMANNTLPIWSPDEDTGMCSIKKDAKYKCTSIYFVVRCMGESKQKVCSYPHTAHTSHL